LNHRPFFKTQLLVLFSMQHFLKNVALGF